MSASSSLMANHAAGNAARPGAPGLQPVGLAIEGGAQLSDARAVLAVGADHVANARILLLQAAAVQVESRRAGTRWILFKTTMTGACLRSPSVD